MAQSDRMIRMPHILTAIVLITLGASISFAQRAGVPIEPRELAIDDEVVCEKLRKLREAGKLMSIKDVRNALSNPSPKAVELPKPATKTLPADQIADRARKSFLRVGWYYLCTRCSRWHTN